MAGLKEIVAFGWLELKREWFKIENWLPRRHGHGGTSDFTNFGLFTAFFILLIFFGLASYRGAMAKIYQAVLDVGSEAAAPIPIWFDAAPDSQFSYSQSALARLRLDLSRQPAPGLRDARVSPVILQVGSRASLSFELTENSRVWREKPGREETRPKMLVVPEDSSLWRRYAADEGQPSVGQDSMSLRLVLNKESFRLYFDYDAYRLAVQEVLKNSAIGGGWALTDLPERLPGGDVGALKKLVLRIAAGSGQYVGFEIVWRENLQTSVPIAGLAPRSIVDLSRLVEYIALRKNSSDMLRDDGTFEALPIDGRGRTEGRILAVLAPSAPAAEMVRDCSFLPAGARVNIETARGQTLLRFHPPLAESALQRCIGKSLDSWGLSEPPVLYPYSSARHCAPGLLIVRSGSKVRAADIVDRLPAGLREPFRRHFDPVAGSGNIDKYFEAFREAVATTCAPGVEPIQPDEIVFPVEDKDDKLIVEFPQDIADLPSAVRYVNRYAFDEFASQACTPSVDNAGQCNRMLRISENQERSLWKTQVLREVIEKTGISMAVLGVGLICFMLGTRITALVDRRTRNYALLEAAGFSRLNIIHLIVLQLTAVILVMGGLAILAFFLVRGMANASFAHSDVFWNAQQKIGFTNAELFQGPPLWEQISVVAAVLVLSLCIAVVDCCLTVFGCLVWAWQKLTVARQGGTAYGRQIIENLTRAP